MRRFLGADISLNHSGFVLLDEDGNYITLTYITDKKASADKLKKLAHLWKKPATKDRQIMEVARIAYLSSALEKIVDQLSPDFVATEGYAYDMPRAHQLGEVGGIFRLLLWKLKIPFRIHDPLTLKMFAAHQGNADKEAVVKAVKKRWDWDFSGYNGGKDLTTEQDLCDAYTLAEMCRTEWLLRRGALRLSDLHEKEVQVFQRATKAAPISILGRDWIQP